jgi:NagD protein
MATSETIVIGDTMETDIGGGVPMGSRTIPALTGTTKTEDLVHDADQPDIAVDSIADLCDPAQLLHENPPTMKREDDTPHDMRESVAAHS